MGKQVINGLKNGLRTLPYIGGKSNFGGPGKWIAEQLAQYSTRTYIEPFCGMLGVLLRRDRAPIEIINDKDGRIVNFFRVVRDMPDEFVRLLSLTAYKSREEWEWARSALDHDSPVHRALAIFICLRNSLPSTLAPRADYITTGGSGRWVLPDDVYALAERLRDVRIDSGDANKKLRKWKQRPDTLIYCDPPYPSTLGYGVTFCADEFVSTILTGTTRAHLVVSGYSHSWPALKGPGWRQITKRIHLQMDTSKRGTRTESLYIYTPD